MNMSEVEGMIGEIGLPYAYYKFRDLDEGAEEGGGQQPPFVTYFFEGREDFYADDRNFAKIAVLFIELYTDEKSIRREQIIENILDDHDLTYEVTTDTYIDAEQMHMTAYRTEVLIDV